MSVATTAPKRSGTRLTPRIDFPTWLPAMLVKELRQGLRTKGFVGALVGFQVVMTLVTVFAIAGGSDSSTFQMLQTCYWVVLTAQLLVITPARGMSGLQSELESRSIDLLLLTRLTAWRVVLGKWVSLLVQAALLVVALLPYGVARYFFGSVDLTGELKWIGVMFVASGAVTAAALWSSALSRVARVGLGIAVFLVIQFAGGFGPSFGAFFSGRSPFAGPLRGYNWLLAFDAALLLALCLLGAVSRLAPAAESKSPHLRALPLIAMLPVPFVGLSGIGQLVFAAILFALIAIIELARNEEPMRCHWRPWGRRGTSGRLIGRLIQPGWASAMEWILMCALVVALAGLFTSYRWKTAHLCVLAAEGLIFPALLLTWMSSQFTQRAAGYFLLLAGASTLAAVAAATASFAKVNIYAEASLILLPISGFWTMLSAVHSPPRLLLCTQLAIAAAILGVAWWRAKPYRLQRRAIDAADPEPAP